MNVPRINVLAGVNGAGKSSVAGATIRSAGGFYYNPDEAAREIKLARPGLTQVEANSAAWHRGRDLLEQAIARRLDFTFETTLGATTMTKLLVAAAAQGIEVHVWYTGLTTPELHIARVRARVARGGHDIPEETIRRRFDHSRLNLITLLPHLASLRVYDNSTEADPAAGKAPRPRLVLHMEGGRIRNPQDLPRVPEWARSIAAAAMKPLK
ncbi:MAG: zeta toxin family protein [Burkholderiales bacterium]|nr:zeta toxin family protein [Burkholderiales bacterium]